MSEYKVCNACFRGRHLECLGGECSCYKHIASRHERATTITTSLRIHAPNGAYLFSLKQNSSGEVVYFFDQRFGAPEWPETPIELYPWTRKEATKDA